MNKGNGLNISRWRYEFSCNYSHSIRWVPRYSDPLITTARPVSGCSQLLDMEGSHKQTDYMCHWKRQGVVLQSGVRDRDNSSMLWIVQTELCNEFYVCGYIIYNIIIQPDATIKWFILHFVTLYIFRVTIPPIIRSTMAVSATTGISRLHVALSLLLMEC